MAVSKKKSAPKAATKKVVAKKTVAKKATPATKAMTGCCPCCCGKGK